MNRLVPLFLMLLLAALSLVAHRVLFIAGYIALDQVCVVECSQVLHTYLISNVSSAVECHTRI